MADQGRADDYDEIEALNADLVMVMCQRNEARHDASMLATALDGMVQHIEAGTVEPSLIDAAKSILRIYREALDAEQ